MCMPAMRVSFHHTLLHFNTMLKEAKTQPFSEEFLWFFFVGWTQICMDFDGGLIKIKLHTVYRVIFWNRLQFVKIFSAIF